MLTRIEIDGFKTFQDFAIDLLPFTVVLGSNAAGKSNLFDATGCCRSWPRGMWIFDVRFGDCRSFPDPGVCLYASFDLRASDGRAPHTSG